MRGADRISSLPDPVLHHILSFLTTTEVVSTRRLSTRWKHLWTCVPILKFTSSDLRDKSKFERFLNFVLEHREPMTLHTFKLWWTNYTSTFEVAERWLSHVVKCEPRVITLVTSGRQDLDFAKYVFTCDSLEELTLLTLDSENDYYAIKPVSVSLKCLRKLNICGKLNLDDDFMKKLMVGSPVLEELQLNCRYAGLSKISSETLKHLEISWENALSKDEEIEISVPSLVSLDIEEGVPGKLSCNNLKSLVNAQMTIDHCCYESDATLLCGFSNATELCFYSPVAVEMFEEELPICPIFNNLKKLTCHMSSFYPVAWFLQHAPNLEELTLKYFWGCDSDYMEENYEGWDVSFSCKQLKILEVHYFDDEDMEDALNILSYNNDPSDDIEVKLESY